MAQCVVCGRLFGSVIVEDDTPIRCLSCVERGLDPSDILPDEDNDDGDDDDFYYDDEDWGDYPDDSDVWEEEYNEYLDSLEAMAEEQGVYAHDLHFGA